MAYNNHGEVQGDLNIAAGGLWWEDTIPNAAAGYKAIQGALGRLGDYQPTGRKDAAALPEGIKEEQLNLRASGHDIELHLTNEGGVTPETIPAIVFLGAIQELRFVTSQIGSNSREQRIDATKQTNITQAESRIPRWVPGRQLMLRSLEAKRAPLVQEQTSLEEKKRDMDARVEYCTAMIKEYGPRAGVPAQAIEGIFKAVRAEAVFLETAEMASQLRYDIAMSQAVTKYEHDHARMKQANVMLKPAMGRSLKARDNHSVSSNIRESMEGLAELMPQVEPALGPGKKPHFTVGEAAQMHDGFKSRPVSDALRNFDADPSLEHAKAVVQAIVDDRLGGDITGGGIVEAIGLHDSRRPHMMERLATRVMGRPERVIATVVSEVSPYELGSGMSRQSTPSRPPPPSGNDIERK